MARKQQLRVPPGPEKCGPSGAEVQLASFERGEPIVLLVLAEGVGQIELGLFSRLAESVNETKGCKFAPGQPFSLLMYCILV